MKSTAAILVESHKPLELEEIEWRPLKYGQILVEVLLSGICGAQLQEVRGEKGTHFPRLLGHEAAVRVIEVGPGVTTVKVGDKCVAHWRVGAGIESEFPHWSFRPVSQTVPAEVLTAGRITTFSRYSVISENRITVVPESTPDTLIALMGCSLSTALGVIENEARLKIGESVLIIGCGGLGMNLILAARLRGAGKIFVREAVESKHALAIQMGADVAHVCRPDDRYDVVIDTTGDSLAIGHSMRDNVASSGRFIMVGQPVPHQDVTLCSARHMFDGNGKTILATQGGRFDPSVDIPKYISAHNHGRFTVDGIVTHTLPLTQINEALDLVRQGKAGRVMLDCKT